jgi:hypothetical protein
MLLLVQLMVPCCIASLLFIGRLPGAAVDGETKLFCCTPSSTGLKMAPLGGK